MLFPSDFPFSAKCQKLLARLRSSGQGQTMNQLARGLGGCSSRTVYRTLAELEKQGCRFTREAGPRGVVRLRLTHDAQGRRQVPAPAARLFLALFRAALGLDTPPGPGNPAAFLDEPSALLAGALGLPATAANVPVGCVIQGPLAVPVGRLPWHLLEPLAQALMDRHAIRVDQQGLTTRLVPHQLQFGPNAGAGVLLAWDPFREEWARLALETIDTIAIDGCGCIPGQAMNSLDPLKIARP